MPQLGYDECGCCGRMYRSDGSEEQLYIDDHGTDYYHDPKEQAYDQFYQSLEGYCDYCERTGHNFRACPERDDTHE